MKYALVLVAGFALSGVMVCSMLPAGATPIEATSALPVAQADETPAADAAVNRTRDTVRMLDDIYKTAVVLITDKYVEDENSFAAGSAAVALFEAIDEKGWHSANLLDVTGDPYDSDNVADDDFEKMALEKIRAGEAFVEAVETKGGKRVFRAMTAVPVVHKKCVLCHEHYADAAPGAAVGAISYAVPIR